MKESKKHLGALRKCLVTKNDRTGWSSEREPADSLRDKSNVIGGRLPSLTFALDAMSGRWAIYIDIEGFGAKWTDTTMEAFGGINALMQGIFWIGDRYYRDPPDRLFAHQFGDGFLVASDFHEEMLDRAVLVSVALLRHVLANGETAKCAISEGEISDIQGCYPPEIRNQLNDWNIQFGSGVMTVTPVLGSALINTVFLAKASPSGPMLSISPSDRERLSCGVTATNVNERVSIVNWLRGEPGGLRELQAAARFRHYSEEERVAQLLAYIEANTSLTAEWKDNASRYLFTGAI